MPKLGVATRSHDKNIRIATHQHVLEWCFKNFKIDYIVEDGMGLSSTPFFHGTNCTNLLSFETNPAWARCTSCANFPNVKHEIILSSPNLEKIKNFLQISEKNVLFFIDGLSTETRANAVSIAIELQTSIIVEHDVEALKLQELEKRKNVLKASYRTFQHVKSDPETLISIQKNIIKNDEIFDNWFIEQT